MISVLNANGTIKLIKNYVFFHNGSPHRSSFLSCEVVDVIDINNKDGSHSHEEHNMHGKVLKEDVVIHFRKVHILVEGR